MPLCIKKIQQIFNGAKLLIYKTEKYSKKKKLCFAKFDNKKNIHRNNRKIIYKIITSENIV